jgi:prevent-host-death family protein
MFTFEEKTTLVGVSELRTKMKEILKQAKENKVFIGKRNKLIAVLLDIEKYKEMEKILEELEDFALGLIAYEREKNSKIKDYLDIEKVEKLIK